MIADNGQSGILPEQIQRAMSPEIRILDGSLGRTLIDALAELPAFVVVSQAEPLAAAGGSLIAGLAAAVEFVDSLDEVELEALLARSIVDAPAAIAVVGLGGGMSLDSAKYVAWRRDLRLVLAPSIISVDACVTNTVAVRSGGSISYRGFVVADPILVDTDLIRQAPTRFNRAGIGDLVSIHTALWDWRLGAELGKGYLDQEAARRSAHVLDRVVTLAEEVASVAPRAIETMIRAYAEVNAICLAVGHSQPEEGSEHYLGYRIEGMTGRSFVHGELIGLATVIMATIQGNDPDRPRLILDRARVAWRLEEIGLDAGLVAEALVSLPTFVDEQRLPWSIANERRLGYDEANDVLRTLG